MESSSPAAHVVASLPGISWVSSTRGGGGGYLPSTPPSGASLPSDGLSLPSPSLSRLMRRRFAMPPPAVKSTEVESLDYAPCDSEAGELLDTTTRRGHFDGSGRSRGIFGYTGVTALKYALVLVLGGITGCLAYALEMSILTAFTARRTHLLAPDGQHAANVTTAILYASSGLGAALGACALVVLIAPSAAGAGVSLVMAFLNGNAVPHIFRRSTLVVKLLGTALSCSSGLAVGPEGPLVTIGAMVAALTVDAAAGCERLFGSSFETTATEVRTAATEREMLSAGCAAGMAAAFGAPIGGVLFSLEEACSHWSRKVAWRCFLASAAAVFVLAQFRSRDNEVGLLRMSGLVPYDGRAWLYQLPLLVMTAAAGGLMGALFNRAKAIIASVANPIRRHVEGSSPSAARTLAWRTFETLIVCALSNAAAVLLPYAIGECVPVNAPSATSSAGEYSLFGRTCGEKEANDLAALFTGPREDTIKSLFSQTIVPKIEPSHPDAPIAFGARSLAVFSGTYLVLMSLASVLSVPAGFFLPSILSGGAMGTSLALLFRRMTLHVRDDESWRNHSHPLKRVVLAYARLLAPKVGNGLNDSPGIQPGVYALVGATAMLGGVFRSSISLVVIVVEGTGAIWCLIGVIISVVVGNYVAHHIHPHGVYESDLEGNNSFTFLLSEPPRRLYKLRAKDVMSSGVVCLREVEDSATIVRVLHETEHNGFPVVRHGEGADHGRYLHGFVLRHQLMVLIERLVELETPAASPAASPGSLAGMDQHDEGVDVPLLLEERDPHAAHGYSQVELIAMERQMRTFHSRRNRHARPFARIATPRAWALTGNSAATPGPAPPPRWVDLRPFIERAPLSVREITRASRIHEMFSSMSLRHLVVVDGSNQVLGIVTRKDLDNAQGAGWWRIVSPAAQLAARFAVRARARGAAGEGAAGDDRGGV